MVAAIVKNSASAPPHALGFAYADGSRMATDVGQQDDDLVVWTWRRQSGDQPAKCNLVTQAFDAS